MYKQNKYSRRQSLKAMARYSILGLVGLSSAAAYMKRRKLLKEGKCINQGFCSNCSITETCGLNQTRQRN